MCLCFGIYPGSVAKSSIWILKDFGWTVILGKLRCCQLLGRWVVGLTRRQVNPRPIVIILQLECIICDPGIAGLPLNVPAGLDAIVEVVVGEDGSHLGVLAAVSYILLRCCHPYPWPTQSAFAFDAQAAVRLVDIALGNVYAIFVCKSRISSLPRCYASSASSQLDVARLNPRSAEAIEEVGLACNRASREIGASYLANIYLGTSVLVL